MLVPIVAQFLSIRREIMPAKYLYDGEAGECYNQMARQTAYFRLRNIALDRAAVRLSEFGWAHAVCLGVGDGRSERELLAPLAPLRSITIHDASGRAPPALQDLARYVDVVDFDLEEADVPAAPRTGAAIGTLLGYTIGNIRNPERLLRAAGRWCEALVIDTPLANPSDPRLRRETWASDAERAWLDAAQRAHHGAVWPVTTKVDRDEEGYTIRLLARGPGREVELLRFRRSDCWQDLFRRCGWEVLNCWIADGPPRATWLLVAPSLGI